MPRTVINRSISFDPQVFEEMEKRREKLLMDRSEYVKRCIMKDMLSGGEFRLAEVSEAFASRATIHNRSGVRKKKK